jgi:hypothetical protein
MAQKAMKQANCKGVIPRKLCATPSASDGHRTSAILWIASPPIQAWIPNQPQATRARMSAGMFAPTVPKDARQNTGKGIP